MKNAVSGHRPRPRRRDGDLPDRHVPAGQRHRPARGAQARVLRRAHAVEAASSRGAAGAAPMLSVEGASYEDALVKANDLLLANLWGDGLPLWPPTRERVDWILRGAALPRTHVIGKFPPRGGVTTVETCAIALAMAGGRPEYLPVLIAAVEAFLDPASNSEQLQATSGSAFPVVIVNGPIGSADPPQLRLRLSRSGSAAPRRREHRARAAPACSRTWAARVPGMGTMANYGGMRYTNVVFAEDEDNLPPGWTTACDRAPRLTRRAPTRSRSRSRTAPPTSGGAARRKRRPRRTRCRACTAWRTSCACRTWPAWPATSAARPAS